MGMLQEFKQFAMKGNVVDLAVGIIIGAAFGKIVDSAVKDLIMPLVGRVGGNQDFSNYYIPLSGQDWHWTLAQAQEKGAVFAYGNFLTVGLQFLIVAFAVFLLVKAINTARHALRVEEEAAPPPPPPEPTAEEKLLAEIRDLLKDRTGSEPPKLGS